MPQFLLSVWHDEDYVVDFSTAEAQDRVAQVGAFNEELQRSGAWVFAAACTQRRLPRSCGPPEMVSR